MDGLLLGSISAVSEIIVKEENVKYHIYLDSFGKVDGLLLGSISAVSEIIVKEENVKYHIFI